MALGSVPLLRRILLRAPRASGPEKNLSSQVPLPHVPTRIWAPFSALFPTHQAGQG